MRKENYAAIKIKLKYLPINMTKTYLINTNCVIITFTFIIAKRYFMDEKIKKLSENGSLNPNPDKVLDAQFKTNDFFDANDLVQVKYEMLRRVHHDSWPVTQATKEFGLSRPVFYQTKITFEKSGVSGLLPQKRGPKQPHKLSKEIMAFIQEQRAYDAKISVISLLKTIDKHFGITIHKRSLEKYLAKNKKKQSTRK
jgi:transposase